MATPKNRKTGISILIGSVLVLGMCLFSAGCLTSTPGTDGNPLKGTEWQLKTYDNGAAGMVSVIEGSTITLTFDDDGAIAGSAGVNRYFASYEVKGDAVSFGTAGTTMMAGPAPLMTQESTYLNLLSETATFVLKENELILSDADGTVLLTFEKIPPVTAESLKGSDWVLRSYNNGNEGIVSVIAGTEITLTLDKDGKISGSAGCNGYFGSYEVKNSAISFDSLGSTLMYCDDPKGTMEQETTFLKLLSETTAFSGVGYELNLWNADGTVLLIFEQIPPITVESLKGSDWVLRSYSEGILYSSNNGHEAVITPITGTEITLSFDEDGRIAGSAGVNRFFASYEAKDDALIFGEIGTTMMAGPEDAMKQESTFLTLLSKTASFSGAGDELNLCYGDKSVLLTFERIPPVTAESLKGSDWVLQSYNDNNAIVSLIPGTEITLTFDEKGRIAGSAGVNNYFASYEANGNGLTFGETGTTMMAGPEDAMKQESTFLKLLSETTAFSGVGDELKLWNADRTVILVFTEVVPAAPESLTGTTWILDSYDGGNGAIVSVITGTEISLSLNNDGEISGSAGCNSYFGPYETDGTALTFGTVGATLMFCDEPKGTMEQETAYLNLLDKAAGYGIEGDRLAVQDASGKIILIFTAAA